MASLRIDNHPYPAYKPSRVPWIKDVPAHWGVGRLKAHLLLNDSGVWGENFDEQGTIVLRSTEQTIDGGWRISNPAKIRLSQKERDSALLETNDLLVTKSSGSSAHIGKTSIVTSSIEAMNCCFSNFVQRLRLNSQVSPLLIWYILNSNVGREQLAIKSTTTTGLGNLNGRIIEDCYIPLPPLPEQAAIVRYLNYADRCIRRYVAAKRKLIVLLEEEKQAVVSRAVTCGLDPTVRLKPSGVEWLGDVPEHWEVTALHHKYSQSLGKMLDSKRIKGDALLPYLRNIDIQWDRINIDDLPTMDIPPSEYDRYTVRPGDLLVCEGGEVGRSALWSGELAICGFQKALHRLRPRRGDVPRFMYYVLRVATNRDVFSDGHVSTIAHLTGEKLRAHRFQFPLLHEQNAIVEYLDKATAAIDDAISSARRQIELVQEYRTRLIADVVTGKLDVREAAAQLPEEDEEPIDEDGPLMEDVAVAAAVQVIEL